MPVSKVGDAKKVLILGGDGFCGWPTSLHLAGRGYEVVIVDNLSRRAIDNELEVSSLTPIQPMGVRLAAWKSTGGREIEFVLPAPDLMVAGFDYDTHLAQRIAYSFADHASDAVRRVKITRLVVGMQGRGQDRLAENIKFEFR